MVGTVTLLYALHCLMIPNSNKPFVRYLDLFPTFLTAPNFVSSCGSVRLLGKTRGRWNHWPHLVHRLPARTTRPPAPSAEAIFQPRVNASRLNMAFVSPTKDNLHPIKCCPDSEIGPHMLRKCTSYTRNGMTKLKSGTIGKREHFQSSRLGTQNPPLLPEL